MVPASESHGTTTALSNPMIANARMYSVNDATAVAWRTLLQWVIARAGVSAEVIDYPAPEPLETLWQRPDLCGVFMCGFPLSQMMARPIVLAAPVPAPPAFDNAPVYWTDLVVRADAPFENIRDTFGHRIAYTMVNSQSGYQAPRQFLAPFARLRGPLFSETVGPLVTPRRVVDSILAGESDVGPLDSYVHALLRVTEPSLTGQLRVVASTARTPIPPLVASAGSSPVDVERLRDALHEVADAEELVRERATLALQRFAPMPAATYDELVQRAAMADAEGYRHLA